MKLFQRAQRSLFGEILDWMLIPLLLLVPVSIGVTSLVAQGIANAPFDRALEHNVKALGELVTVREGRTEFVLSQPAVTCAIPGTARVRHMRDNLAAGTGTIPEPGWWKDKLEALR